MLLSSLQVTTQEYREILILWLALINQVTEKSMLVFLIFIKNEKDPMLKSDLFKITKCFLDNVISFDQNNLL